MLWILLWIGVQRRKKHILKMFGKKKTLCIIPVGILHNGCASFVQSLYYYACCCHSLMHLRALSITINSGQAEVMVENAIENFVSCTPLKHFFTSKYVFMGKAGWIFQVEGFIIVLDFSLLGSCQKSCKQKKKWVSFLLAHFCFN